MKKQLLLGVLSIGLCVVAFAQNTSDFVTFKDDYGVITLVRYTGTAVDVVIPATIDNILVDKIGKSAFAGRTDVRSVAIPNSVRSIKKEAFRGCTGLSAITMPAGLETIEEGVFIGCTGLKSITLPTGLTSIKSEAFYGCTALTSVSLPASLRDVKNRAFLGCTQLNAGTKDEILQRFGSRPIYGKI
ncbi:MAG: leucine-rich repeat domain-containing protein [Treponema sp.]|jgi:phage tail tube protein FII|nr:leucine-rich repeat domain-containing protein [Treponema sp.]